MSHANTMLHEKFDEQLAVLFAECGKKVGEIQDLHRKKGEDYENEVGFTEYYEEGLRDLWILLNRKTLRLKSLVGREGQVREPNYEKISEEAMELASFALWFSAWAEIGESGAKRKVSDPGTES